MDDEKLNVEPLWRAGFSVSFRVVRQFEPLSIGGSDYAVVRDIPPWVNWAWLQVGR